MKVRVFNLYVFVTLEDFLSNKIVYWSYSLASRLILNNVVPEP